MNACFLPVQAAVRIVNDSIEQGIFPDISKRACVTPIYKSGSKDEFANYRPISVLPLLSKIFERCICSRLVSYLSNYNILSACQFGFRKNLSTTNALMNVVENVYAQLNCKNHTSCVSLDFSKAFDTVSHNILLEKLFGYGIRGLAFAWFKSYLNGRTQRVRVGDAFSQFEAIGSGVPQGSILCPILFLIYINDLPNVCIDCDFTLYADDATLMITDHDYTAMVDRANADLTLVREWTVDNRLTLNAEKTSAMLFTNRSTNGSHSLISLSGSSLDYVDQLKFLGVVIDNKLCFSTHINNITSKISKLSGVLHSISSCAPESNLVDLYYSLVYPHLIYGILLWGGSAKVHLQPLTVAQKKIFRVITDSHNLAHTAPLFHRIRILQLEDIYRYYVGIHMFKLKMNNSVVYLTHTYDTRNNRNILPSFQRLTSGLRSISSIGPRSFQQDPPKNSKFLLTCRI